MASPSMLRVIALCMAICYASAENIPLSTSTCVIEKQHCSKISSYYHCLDVTAALDAGRISEPVRGLCQPGCLEVKESLTYGYFVAQFNSFDIDIDLSGEDFSQYYGKRKTMRRRMLQESDDDYTSKWNEFVDKYNPHQYAFISCNRCQSTTHSTRGGRYPWYLTKCHRVHDGSAGFSEPY